MADLTDLQSADSVKIVGANSTGVETNPLNVDAQGNAFVNLKSSAGTEFASSASAPVGTETALVSRGIPYSNSGTGTITANGQTVIATVTGGASVSFVITGTYVANMQLEASTDGTTWIATYGRSPDLLGTYTLFNSNTTTVVPAGGFHQIRLRCSSYTSGTVNIGWRTTQGTNTIATISLRSADNLGQFEGVQTSGSVVTSNPFLLGARYSTTPETFGDTTLTRLQSDVNGRLLVNASQVDSTKTSYSATSLAFTAALTATDIFTLTGSASKTIRITKIVVSATQTTAGDVNIILLKRSTANSAGTSSNLVEVPHDSNSAAASATALSYTANPTTGTLVGNLRAVKLFVGTTLTASTIYTEDFGSLSQTIILRGTSQVFAVNLNSTTVTGNNFNISIEWLEE